MKSANGRVKKQFDFTEEKIERTVTAISKKMMWLDCTTALSTLQAVYHFAAYLQACGNIVEPEKLTIQKDCTTLYHKAYPLLQNESTEAICFKTFPFIWTVAA